MAAILDAIIYEKCFTHPCFFHGGHFENHPKWRSGLKISSVNILILNQGGLMNNIIPFPEGP